MDIDAEIKPNWFMQWLGFKPKKVSCEILPELTPDEKVLKKKLKLEHLKSDIRVSPTKFGGCGICCYCRKWQHNLSFHEARCPQRVELGGRGRG